MMALFTPQPLLDKDFFLYRCNVSTVSFAIQRSQLRSNKFIRPCIDYQDEPLSWLCHRAGL